MKNLANSVVLRAVCLTTAVCAANAVQAEEINISSWAPPTQIMNSKVFPHWGNCIKQATGGQVTWKIEYNLAPPPAQFNVVRKGIGDASWIFHGYNAGRYVATKVAEFPGAGPNSTAVSVAYWRTQVKYLDKMNEHRGVRLVGLMTHGPAALMTRRPVTKIAQLDGVKLRLPGGVATELFATYGVVPVKVASPKVYEVLSTGVADGVTMPIETQKSLKLAEVVKHVVTIPGGFYFGSFGIIMNPRKYASMSKPHQAAVDKCSGEPLSRFAGTAWQRSDVAGLAVAKIEGTVIEGDAAMRKAVADVAKKLEAKWIADMKNKGMDNAGEALAYLRQQAVAHK